MNIELEIKLAIHEAAILQLPQHPLLQKTLKKPAQKELISTYFDTSAKQLRKTGYALRIREEAGNYIQTLKGRAKDKSQLGLTARHEWEWPLAEFKIDAALFPQQELQKLFAKPSFLLDFGPQFVTRFTRRTWDIELADETQVEIALDQGKIIAGDSCDEIQELELELKKGNPETLKALAYLFQTELKLEPENRSKAARGFALL